MLDLLKDGPVDSKSLIEAMEARGIASRTVWRIKDDLGIKAQKKGFNDGWEWYLPPAAKAADDLAHGRTAGVDRRQAERLSRGRLTVEATLDLHGLTQAAARERLDVFIAAQSEAGRRCVLVITGKGLMKEDGGVLRQQVPRWLNQSPNRGRVLAFDYAQPKHGGMGALYVLLKRRRERGRA